MTLYTPVSPPANGSCFVSLLLPAMLIISRSSFNNSNLWNIMSGYNILFNVCPSTSVTLCCSPNRELLPYTNDGTVYKIHFITIRTGTVLYQINSSTHLLIRMLWSQAGIIKRTETPNGARYMRWAPETAAMFIDGPELLFLFLHN